LPTKMPTNNFCPPNACFLKILINEEKSQIWIKTCKTWRLRR
jgi:hypothetical protein